MLELLDDGEVSEKATCEIGAAVPGEVSHGKHYHVAERRNPQIRHGPFAELRDHHLERRVQDFPDELRGQPTNTEALYSTLKNPSGRRSCFVISDCRER